MKIFLSYASEDKNMADEINLNLIKNHQVFFDRTGLEAGDNFNEQIAEEVQECDLFIFLISPDSVVKPSYALTELGFARKKWEYPEGYLLPVMIRETNYDLIPTYLKAVTTILEPEGNIAAEVRERVNNWQQNPKETTFTQFPKIWNVLWTIATFVLGILSSFLFPPPEYITQQQIFSNFGKFVAAIVVGLVIVAINFWGLREHTRNWWIATCTSLLLFILCLFSYQHFTQKWTCRCDPAEKAVYVIGSDFKSPVVDSVEQNPDPNNCNVWLFENDCDSEEVWTKDSISRNRLMLGIIYILTLSIGVICMMSVTQALYCSLRKQ